MSARDDVERVNWKRMNPNPMWVGGNELATGVIRRGKSSYNLEVKTWDGSMHRAEVDGSLSEAKRLAEELFYYQAKRKWLKDRANAIA